MCSCLISVFSRSEKTFFRYIVKYTDNRTVEHTVQTSTNVLVKNNHNIHKKGANISAIFITM